jgi:hypothetical protein
MPLLPLIFLTARLAEVSGLASLFRKGLALGLAWQLNSHKQARILPVEL